MKKSNKIMLAIYIVIGIALVIIGVTIQVDYYSSMIFAMGFALIFSSILQLVRYYHNTRPENVEAYRKKVRQQEINLRMKERYSFVIVRDIYHGQLLWWRVLLLRLLLHYFVQVH